MLPQGEVGLNPQVRFTKGDEHCNVKNTVRGQMMKLHPVEVQEGADDTTSPACGLGSGRRDGSTAAATFAREINPLSLQASEALCCNTRRLQLLHGHRRRVILGT